MREEITFNASRACGTQQLRRRTHHGVEMQEEQIPAKGRKFPEAEQSMLNRLGLAAVVLASLTLSGHAETLKWGRRAISIR